MSVADFLAWEIQQPTRHEFFRGKIFATTGGPARHNRVILNLAAGLSAHLDGTSCQVFAESMKVQLSNDAVLYPDVMVSCGKERLLQNSRSERIGAAGRRSKWRCGRPLLA